ncbi:MAG: TetR/AcrR family transcriptional regulator [Chitinophagales bacterium]
MTQEQQILIKAESLFFKLGVKSITMDDLAREMGVSKKTIYKYVDNKADLVKKVMQNHFEQERSVMDSILSAHDNAIDEMIAIIRNVLKHVRGIHPSSIYDIQKYYPESWAMFKEFKDNFIYSCVLNNLQHGKEEGFYRENFNPEIIAKIYVHSIDFVVNPMNFPPTEYSFVNLYLEYIRYHLRGIASIKGIEYLKNIQLNEDDK